MAKLTVKNWKDFQHYKDRSPPWIKLHKGLLDNYEYQRLPIASRALAPMLWLLASESNDGSIDHDPAKIAFRLRTTEAEVIEAIKPLIAFGFMVADSEALAECYQDAIPEREVEREAEKEGEAEQRKKDAPPAARGTRLPIDWQCPEEWISDATQIKPHWTRPKVLAVADAFRDYWIGSAGAKGRKTDWRATWRNWCRNERDDRAPIARAPSGRQSVIDNYAAQAAAARGNYEQQPTGEQNELDITGECTRIA